MNMNMNPTVGELRELIRECDDVAAHHVLWVAHNGDVHVSEVPKDRTPAGYQDDQPDMQLRFETFLAGNEYVGPEAAEDDGWINQMFGALTKEWPRAKAKPKAEYVDLF